MTTSIHVNELEEVPLKTSAAVLNCLYPPPPHTHTQNDDVNSRYESEEVPLTFNDVISSCGSYSVIVNFPRFFPCFTNQS